MARRGCTAADVTFSLAALRELTMRFSAEDAIRPFINSFPEQTLRTLQQWAGDDHYHMRRLCSEGTRPLLPWSRRLDTPADYAVGLLARLHADPTRFVTRSVANHVNDLSKLDTDLALALLRDWLGAGHQAARKLDYLVRHATRTLVKRGHPGALELLGIRTDALVRVEAVDVPATAVLGGALTFSVTLMAGRATDAVVDYVLRFASSGGTLTRRRVYKLTRLALAAGEPVTVTKRHALPVGMTTVPLYPGRQELQVQVNGRVVGTWQFTLLALGTSRR